MTASSSAADESSPSRGGKSGPVPRPSTLSPSRPHTFHSTHSSQEEQAPSPPLSDLSRGHRSGTSGHLGDEAVVGADDVIMTSLHVRYIFHLSPQLQTDIAGPESC